jgi:hypothetical protein
VETIIKLKSRIKNSSSNIGIFIVSLLVQLIFIGKYLDNSVISDNAPMAVDATDYVDRAEIWKRDGFQIAFGDAFRMPGYPSFIFVMSFFFPNHVFLASKLFQMIGLALSAVMIKILLEKIVSPKFSLLATVFFILLPIWHFTPILLAESLTASIFMSLTLVLSRITVEGVTKKQIFVIATLIAILTYLKPNNSLMIIPVLVFLYFKVHHGALRSMLYVTSLFVLLMAPWLGFANQSNPGFYGLTTNSGVNLYVGTGMTVGYDGSVLSGAAIHWGVDPKNNPDDVVDLPENLSPLQANQLYQDKAVQIWEERPLQMALYGFEKILIAFGIKANSHQDYLLGIFHLGGVIAGIILLRFSEYRIWGILLFSTFLLLATQAAIFQADRRFIAPFFFPISVINLTLVLTLFSRYWGRLKVLNKMKMPNKQDGD